MPEQLSDTVERLATVVEGLGAEVGKANRIAKSNRSWIRLILVTFIVGALAFIGAVGWNRHDIDRSNRQWCGTLNILTDPQPAPTTDRGRDSLRELTRLRDSFGCRGIS